jgi:4'-phosphopantetheinyl transferase
MEYWDPTPIDYKLPPEAVHIWKAALSLSTLNAQASTLLSPDELARSGRFHFDRDRERYIAGRAILRLILARYLGCPPAEVAFTYGPQGKPALAAPWNGSGLSFNATHSHDLALYAIARERRVGIDIEHLREIPEARGIARRYFTAGEAMQLESTEQPATAFLRLWTRKEAVIKAVGVGLSMPLNCFDLSAVPGDGTASFDVDDAAAQWAVWTLHELSPGPEYVAAVVIEGEGARLRRFQFFGTAQLEN